MYILNARIFTLGKQLDERVAQKNKNRGIQYICSNYRTGLCRNNKDIDEIEYENGGNECAGCGSKLIEN